MKYLNPATRKRPLFEELLKNYNTTMCGVAYSFSILCICGEHLHTRAMAFDHWQNGHFDVYDEYKEKE